MNKPNSDEVVENLTANRYPSKDYSHRVLMPYDDTDDTVIPELPSVTDPEELEVEERRVASRIQAYLADHPEFREAEYDPDTADAHPLTGHCYTASEAFHAAASGELDQKESPYRACHYTHEDVSHWFVETPDGDVVDLTYQQFDTGVPYEEGEGMGFLSYPSEDTERVLEDTGLHPERGADAPEEYYGSPPTAPFSVLTQDAATAFEDVKAPPREHRETRRDLAAYLHGKRPEAAQRADESFRSPTAESLKQWVEAPARTDVPGVDTPGEDTPPGADPPWDDPERRRETEERKVAVARLDEDALE